jgi:hypothetical protein
MNLFAVRELVRIPSKLRDWMPRCSNPGCCRQSLKHAVSRRYSGVNVAEAWYCSPDCFEDAARTKIQGLLSARGRSEPATSLRMPLGLLLVSREVLSVEQLKMALDHQRTGGASIGEVVQELGFATQEQVAAAVAAQWACPLFSLAGRPLPREVRIPPRLLELYGMLPVHFVASSRKLLMGFVSRVQYHALHTIEQMTDCVASPCIITAREYWQYLQSIIPDQDENEVVLERCNSAAEVATLLRNYAHQFAAEEARFGLCRDYVWARLRGRERAMNLLFRLQCDR